MSIVHGILSKEPKAKCAICGQEHKFSLPINDYGANAKWSDDPKYAKWSVDEDSTVELNDDLQTKFEDTLR